MEKHRVASVVGCLAVFMAGLLSIGCGRSPAYDPEPEFPQGYSAQPPAPLTNDELAARMQAQPPQQEEQAQAQQDVAIGPDADEYGDTDPSALTEWRPVLDGHGQWVDDPTYGTVWVPAANEVGGDFQPYVTAGHWTYGDDPGWVWVSDYEWGWVPFHYGRWVYLPTNGWVWIPGRRYSGAWVVWRGDPGYEYVGWAPAPPLWYWYGGVAVGWSFGWYDYHQHYAYCSRSYIYHEHVNTYVVRGPGARVHDGRTAEYVPAHPGVGGGGRVVAQPSVNGTGGRVLASPSVASSRGPRPQDMGIKGETIVAPPKNNSGLERAQAYSTARSAMSRGAQAPAHSTIANAGPASSSMRAEGGSNVAPLPGRQSATPSFGPSSPGASSFASRSVGTPTYSPPRGGDGPLPSYRSSPSASVPSSSFRSSSPTFRSSSPSVSSSPTFHSWSPSVSSSPTFRSSSPSVSSSPSFHASSPTFHSSSPSVSSHASSPSFHSSSPSVSHSSPSVSTHASAPSGSHSSSRGRGGRR